MKRNVKRGYLTRRANYIKSVIASYWRYDKQCPIVAVEANVKLRPWPGGDRADILVMTQGKLLIEIEVKTNIEDLRRDINKEIHKDLDKKVFSKYPVHAFFFAVLYDIAIEAEEIIREHFINAGLLVVQDYRTQDTQLLVKLIKPAIKFKKPVLGEGQIRQLTKAMSSTVCRLLRENNELKNMLNKEESCV